MKKFSAYCKFVNTFILQRTAVIHTEAKGNLSLRYCDKGWLFNHSVSKRSGFKNPYSEWCKRNKNTVSLISGKICHTNRCRVPSAFYKYCTKGHRESRTLPCELKNKMDATSLLPPESVRGMTSLDYEAFTKTIAVPTVLFSTEDLKIAVKCLKTYLLKLQDFPPVQSYENGDKIKIVYLNPILLKTESDVAEVLAGCDQQVTTASVTFKEITIKYNNWSAHDILCAVLPEATMPAFSCIGHIVHLNIREHNLPYKYVIGKVLLDKTKTASLVVNKTVIIDESDCTYRTFKMETLAGDGDTWVSAKENGCVYCFNFAEVYFNPRLQREHERIVAKLNPGDRLYDVMAGVGPFAIPVGKKKCTVLANDLNPSCYNSLVENCKINKVSSYVHCYNLDGRDFIHSVLKEDMISCVNNSDFTGNIHITMNLPSLAKEFLPSYIGLLHDIQLPSRFFSEKNLLPIVHVYLFSNIDSKDFVVNSVAAYLTDVNDCKEHFLEQLGDKSNEELNETNESECSTADHSWLWKHIEEVTNVRAVSTSKYMMRVSFKLFPKLLLMPPIKHLSKGGKVTVDQCKLQQYDKEVAGTSIKKMRMNDSESS